MKTARFHRSVLIGLLALAMTWIAPTSAAEADRCEPSELPFRLIESNVLPVTDEVRDMPAPAGLDDEWVVFRAAYDYAATQIREYEEGGDETAKPYCDALFLLYPYICPENPPHAGNENEATLLGCLNEFGDRSPGAIYVDTINYTFDVVLDQCGPGVFNRPCGEVQDSMVRLLDNVS